MKCEAYMKELQQRSENVINTVFHEDHKKAWSFVNKALEENKKSVIHNYK